MQFSIGPPLISVEALAELRAVLDMWQTSSDCLSGKEEINERSARPFDRQMNLSLLEAPATTSALGKRQVELTLALAELLLNAAQDGREKQANGEDDERPEAHD
jgi:hypothetical protein